ELPVRPKLELLCRRPFFVRVPVQAIPLAEAAIVQLALYKNQLCEQLRKSNRPEEVYWSAGIRNYASTDDVSVDVQIDVDYAVDLKVPRTIGAFIQDFIKLPVNIELGMAARAVSDDSWANRTHRSVRPGISISAEDGRCTVTAIVRPRVADQQSDTFALTVGHGVLPALYQKSNGSTVYAYQPSGNESIDYRIGVVVGGCYDPVHNAELEFDAGLIRLLNKNSANSFGTDGH